MTDRKPTTNPASTQAGILEIATLVSDDKAWHQGKISRSFIAGALRTLAHRAEEDAARLREMEAEVARVKAQRREAMREAWPMGVWREHNSGPYGPQMEKDLTAIERKLDEVSDDE